MNRPQPPSSEKNDSRQSDPIWTRSSWASSCRASLILSMALCTEINVCAYVCLETKDVSRSYGSCVSWSASVSQFLEIRRKLRTRQRSSNQRDMLTVRPKNSSRYK